MTKQIDLNRENPFDEPESHFCIHDLFERQAKYHPHQVAITFEGDSLTYQVLNQKANQLAHYLAERGISSGTVIAVFLESPLAMVLSLLGIFKAGGVCTLLFPDLLPNQKNDSIQSIEPVWIITQRTLSQNLPTTVKNVICVDDIVVKQQIEQQKATNFPSDGLQRKANEKAYILYHLELDNPPVGAIGSHKSIVSPCMAFQNTFPLQAKDVFCQTISLDGANFITDVFLSLLNGASLVLSTKEQFDKTPVTIDFLKHYQVSHIELSPSQLSNLITHERSNELTHLKMVFCSGSPLTLPLATRFSQRLPDVRLINVYKLPRVGIGVMYYEVHTSNYKNIKNHFEANQEIHFFNEFDVQDKHKRLSHLKTETTRPDVTLSELREAFNDTELPITPVAMDHYLEYLHQTVIPHLVNVSSQVFIGHMTSVLPNFIAEFNRLITRLNQNVVKIETSKSLTFLERQVVAILHRLFFDLSQIFYNTYCQDPNHVFGLVTSGGSIANLTALSCARNKGLLTKGISQQELIQCGANQALKKLGYQEAVILGSRLLHYSIRKTALLLGLGEANILFANQDTNQKLSMEDLEVCIQDCQKKNQFIIAIIGIAGATETGTVDPLPQMAQIAQKHKIPFHVDAAWGGAFQLSDRYKHKLQGIEQADSVTFCGHKQMFLPQGVSFCLFRDPKDNGLIPVNANYQAEVDSYDLGQYSIEGSRPAYSLILHASLNLLSKSGYAWLIDQSMVKAQYLKKLIDTSDSFELIGEPDLNIINYRYIPLKLRDHKGRDYTKNENGQIDEANERLQKTQFLKGRTFVSKTKLLHPEFADYPLVAFRVVLINPLTTVENLHQVLKDQLQIANECIEDNRLLLDEDSREPFVEEPLLENQVLPVGSPLGPVSVYLLDEDLNSVPPGKIGALYIGGDCLPLEYLNLPKDSNHPAHSPQVLGRPSSKWYKTGDFARVLPDGNIELVD